MKTGKAFIAAALALGLAGCGKTESQWNPISDNNIRIAVIGFGDYIAETSFPDGVQLASDAFFEKTGISITTELYDDEMDYSLSIATAKAVSQDKGIAAVVLMQELDLIDACAEIYNNAQKPFIITDNCHESAIGYEYMLVDCINAWTAGNLMARYVEESGYKNIAFCHSNTEYEVDEVNGFHNALSGGARLVDTLIGPYSDESFNISYRKWKSLGVDAVCVSNYYIPNSDVVRLLREKGSDIPVIGDCIMDNSDDIDKNGEYLDGTAIIGRYVRGSYNEEVLSDFREKYGYEMDEIAFQGYDIASMIGEELYSGVSSSKELIENIKSQRNYQGVAGKINFDEKGCLIPNGNEILVFKDGRFI